MKIIVAGFSKTGTKSLAIAFTELGYSVYDMLEHFWYHGKEWERLLVDGGSVEDFKEMYKDVDVVLDAPVFSFWEQILEAFPDAKIILTMRDEEKWFKSWEKQMTDINGDIFFNLMQTVSPSGRKMFAHLKRYCPPVFGFAIESPWKRYPINKMVLVDRYKQHYQYVLKNAPKNKLLIYRVQDGWEPLCEFLGHDIPPAPFPHENVGGKVIELFIRKNPIMQRIVKETFVSCGVLFLSSIALAILMYKVL